MYLYLFWPILHNTPFVKWKNKNIFIYIFLKLKHNLILNIIYLAIFLVFFTYKYSLAYQYNGLRFMFMNLWICVYV